MFKRLRIKLTLINIMVLGLILTFVFSGIYILMARGMIMNAERAIRMVPMQIRVSERFSGGPLIIKRNAQDSFYANLDSSGKIIGKSSDMPINDVELDLILMKTQKHKNDRGNIRINGETYRFMKFPSLNDNSMSIVYLNIQREKEFLTMLAAIFVIIGLISIGLAFFGSLFLADKALIPIKDAWEKQKNFVADASHELRTPISSIQTNLEVVLDNQDETVENQSKWLNNILSENKRMAKLVDDLLLLARADSQQENMVMLPFCIDKAMKEAAEPYEPIAARKGIELDVQLDDNVSYTGDEAHIKQLIVILLDNAIKYTPANGLVRVEMNNCNNSIEILVSDTGDGIKEEEREKIFERFYRLDKARSRQSGGSGLGLSIARWIVKEHGGSISVSNGEIKGSVFKVILPKNRGKKLT